MLKKLYARWMYSWETKLTTQDSNRVVRPVEWGFEWLADWIRSEADPSLLLRDEHEWQSEPLAAEKAMLALSEDIVAHSARYFSYRTPQDFRLEARHPELFPTNVRPKTLHQEARIKQRAAEGKIDKAPFLRFTSPARTPYPENDIVNARWYPAPPEKQTGKPLQAIIVMPQWNADAFSHNALCRLFNRFGISALRLSKPFHDIRRPLELERSDYAVSSNVGRTIASVRQAVVDISSCIDWLEQQGYEQFGVLGTSLGSCYGFIAAAHDPRIRVCAFNHASTWFGDVVWTGQSTRHIREAFQQAGFTGDDAQLRLRRLWQAVSPMAYMEKFAASPRQVRVVYAPYDLTFLREFSEDVFRSFRKYGIDFDSKMLPCGHYTTGESPFKYIDGWYLGSFVYNAFKRLAKTPPPPIILAHEEAFALSHDRN